MHVLVTTDTLSDVWVYTRELVTGLVARGTRVTLVSLGEIPLPHQIEWMDRLEDLDYRPTGFRLDWMQGGDHHLAESSAFLVSLIREVKPDVLHFNHLCYGGLPVQTPRLVVAHSDLISWWKAVHGHEPDAGPWWRWHREAVLRGLLRADVVVAPSVWMLDTIRACYGEPAQGAVIYNGRNPINFNPYVAKEDSVLAVGRLWDAGKQVSLLTQHAHPLPVCIAGAGTPVETVTGPIRTDVRVAVDTVRVAVKGPQTEAQLRTLYSRASIYAATSRYESFGMAALEAALSRCAIVANDIPSFREIWGDAALYFRTNDATSLAALVRSLSDDRPLCQAYGNRAYQRARECFTALRMVDEYLRLYRSLAGRKRAAA